MPGLFLQGIQGHRPSEQRCRIDYALFTLHTARQADVEQQYMLNASFNVYLSMFMACGGIIILQACKKDDL